MTYISFFLDSAPAPTIILILTLVFIVTFVYRNITTIHAQRKHHNPTANEQ